MNNQSSATSKNELREVIQNSNEEFIEKDLIPFLKIPSYSLNPEGIREAIDFLASYLSSFCEEVEEIEGEINPSLIAKIDGEIKDRLLIYMMYDTQPVHNENEWIKNPFKAELVELPEPLDRLGKVIIARGAYNSKTPLMCFLNVVKLLKENAKLPISLLLLIDGEEELGSPSLVNTLKLKKSEFRACIDAYYPSIKQDLNGKSVLKLGYKGILSFSIHISSLNKESHSAFSGIIPNPAGDLISLINTIYNNNEFLINSLKKSYEISKEELQLIDKLMKAIDIEKIKEKAGIVEANKINSRTFFIDYLFKPTFNVSTLKSGYLKHGFKNYVPNEAVCKIDVRFAHKVSVNTLYKEIKEKVESFAQNSKSKIRLIKNIGYESSRVKSDSILIKSLVKTAENLGFATEMWPLSAAAAPLSIIQKVLGLNFITGGLGIGGYAHAPNEFVQLSSIRNTRLANCLFLKTYSNFYNKM